ncbi:MAG: hypothetical protein ACK5II_06205 [Paracoccus sp. (in: a-proteobacteria)]
MDEDDLWFVPGPVREDSPYGRRTDRLSLIDVRGWEQAQASLVVPLARAAQALGALDAVVVADRGMIRRLALVEAKAMLWAEGTPLPREDIGRDLMAARASSISSPGVMAKARWAIRRLEGQADTADLREFLDLRRIRACRAHLGSYPAAMK